MTEMLQDIFNLCIVPLLGIITNYLVKYFQKKTSEIESKANNELVTKYIYLLDDMIHDCVIATNQTYVNALKNKNAFDKEAQKEAFNQTYDKVMEILSDEMRIKLLDVYDDLQSYIFTKIEVEVNLNKEQ